MNKIIMLALLTSFYHVSEIECLRKGPSYHSGSYEMPKECQKLGQKFCTSKGTDYPQKYIDTILKNSKILSSQRIGLDEEVIESRFSDAVFHSECTTNTPTGSIFGTVYYVLDKANKTRVVINSDTHDFYQKFTLRWCANEGPTNKTMHFTYGNFNKHNVTMTCNNIKMSLNILVLNLELTNIEPIHLDMPVYCKAILV